MIHFWNPWDQSHTQGTISESLETILRIRKVMNVQKLGFWRILSVLMRILSIKPTLWYIFGILGTKAILRIWFQNHWKPSWGSGRSWMSKIWGIIEYWWGFCQLNLLYGIFLESMGPKPYSGCDSIIFGNHPEDQKGNECQKTGI